MSCARIRELRENHRPRASRSGNLFNRHVPHIERDGPDGQKVEVIKMPRISSISDKKGEREVALALAPEDWAVS